MRKNNNLLPVILIGAVILVFVAVVHITEQNKTQFETDINSVKEKVYQLESELDSVKRFFYNAKAIIIQTEQKLSEAQQSYDTSNLQLDQSLGAIEQQILDLSDTFESIKDSRNTDQVTKKLKDAQLKLNLLKRQLTPNNKRSDTWYSR